jgi:general secretion pathway protein K
MRHARQRGIALLVAIVMFAIATTVAAAITYNKAMAARRAAATFTLEQAVQAGMAAESFAAIVLEDNGKKNRTEINDPWAEPFGPVEIEGTGVWIQAQLEDLTGRFNLNSLVSLQQGPQPNTYKVDTHQYEVFQEILRSLDIDLRYADLLVDWIDPDSQPMPQGGEDTMYLTQTPPYRPPNSVITHTSELLALPGFGPENYAKIAPLVTALPNTESVNTCTASGLVLDATANDPQGNVAYRNQNLKNLREKGCFPINSDFIAGIIDANAKAAAQPLVTEKSSWFRLRTNIRIGTAEFVLYSVLFREPNNHVRTMQRSFGSE